MKNEIKSPCLPFHLKSVLTFAASHRGASAVAEAEIIPIEPDTDNAGAGKVNSSNLLTKIQELAPSSCLNV